MYIIYKQKTYLAFLQEVLQFWKEQKHSPYLCLAMRFSLRVQNTGYLSRLRKQINKDCAGHLTLYYHILHTYGIDMVGARDEGIVAYLETLIEAAK